MISPGFSSDTRDKLMRIDAGGPSPITWHWAWLMERYKFGPGALTMASSVDDQEAIVMIWLKGDPIIIFVILAIFR